MQGLPPTRGSLLLSVMTMAVGVSLATLSSDVQAKSSLSIPAPTETGDVAAATFDLAGARIGDSALKLLQGPSGRYLLRVIIGIDGGGRSQLEAEFEPIDAGEGEPRRLRLLSQRSQGYTPEGSPMTLLRIDHEAREASCTEQGTGSDAREAIPLPEDDRVANVPMHLLFLPLVRGEVDRIRFQLFVCRGGPKLHDFVALRGRRPREVDGRSIVEIRYGPDLGKLMSWVASRVLPKLSFWFDADANWAYVAHRTPIYTKGPEVLVIRSGIAPEALGAPL